MTVRNVSGTYALNDGTMLPGYNQESSILGFNNSFSAPLGGFVFFDNFENSAKTATAQFLYNLKLVHFFIL
jgi:hypothetical protein